MNLPNKLTLFRVIMVPFFVFFLLGRNLFGCPTTFSYIALGIFFIASITDLFDGIIARKRNLITNFGKFMDPLADKVLVCSAFICLSAIGEIPAWITVVVICREFVVSGLRLIAVEDGKVIAASMWGKAKTFVSMAMIVAVMLDFDKVLGFELWYYLEQVLIYASLILTVISIIDYIRKNWNILKDGMA